MMRVTIHQPQYLPWLGYLDKIDQADVFVILDSVQFKKNEWQNRNRIRTAQGWQWLTVPVRHRFGQKIQDVVIEESSGWRARHLRALEIHYSRAAFRDEGLGSLQQVYQQQTELLADLNVATVRWFLQSFDIQTPMILASEIETREEPTDRLIDICRAVGATHYLAGPGAGAYMNVSKFKDSGVNLEIQEFQHPQYNQCYKPFLSGLSALDLLFNHGSQGLKYLRENRIDSAVSVKSCS
jgi:hypothetical protein